MSKRTIESKGSGREARIEGRTRDRAARGGGGGSRGDGERQSWSGNTLKVVPTGCAEWMAGCEGKGRLCWGWGWHSSSPRQC